MLPIPHPNFAEELSVIESYQFFDRPVLFSCHDRRGHAYLAVWADEKEDTDQETWVFTPIHPGVLDAVRSGSIELQAAFRNGIDGRAFLVDVDWNTQSSTVREVSSSELSDDLLPEPGERVTPTADLVEHSLPQLARQSQRVVSNVELRFADPTQHRAPARLVGNILQTFQASFEAMVHAEISLEPSRYGRIPDEIMSRAQLNVQAFNPGSFGMRLESAQEGFLFVHEPVFSALSKMAGIISAKSQEDLLRDYTARITGRFAARYILLLQNLAAGEASLKLEWAVPNGHYGVAELSATEASEAVQIVSRIARSQENEFRVVGELIGFNSRNGNFEIYDSETDMRYVGKVANDFATSIGFTTNQTYLATIQEIIEINRTTLEERTKYRLAGLVQID